MYFRSRKVPEYRKPFGFIMDNGLNFAKSIHNPLSVVRGILRVVMESSLPLTKREILTRMGYKVDTVRKYRRAAVDCGDLYFPAHTDIYHDKPCRGYLSWYFSGLHKAGFLVPIRTAGNTVRWYIGPNFPKIEKIVEVDF